MKRVKTSYDLLNFDVRLWVLSSAAFRAGMVLMAVLIQHFVSGQHNIAIGLGNFLIPTGVISMVVYIVAFNAKLGFRYKYISIDMIDHHRSYQKSLRNYYLDIIFLACNINLAAFVIVVFSGPNLIFGWSNGTLMMCGFSIVINMIFDYTYCECKCCDGLV